MNNKHPTLVKSILSNTICNRLYCDFVYLQYLIFATIEDRIQLHSKTARKQIALDDWQDMQYSLPPDLSSIENYTSLLRNCDLSILKTHVYINYIGLMIGSPKVTQAIEHRFPTRLYTFDNAQDSIDEIVEKTAPLSDISGNAFGMIWNLYEDLSKKLD